MDNILVTKGQKGTNMMTKLILSCFMLLISVSCLVKPEAKVTVRFKNNTSSWTTLFGTSDTETYSTWITVDSNSNIYSVGFLDGGTEDFEGQPRINSTDSFVSKFDFDGNKTWTKVFGTSSGEDIVFYAATTDSNGNIFLNSSL